MKACGTHNLAIPLTCGQQYSKDSQELIVLSLSLQLGSMITVGPLQLNCSILNFLQSPPASSLITHQRTSALAVHFCTCPWMHPDSTSSHTSTCTGWPAALECVHSPLPLMHSLFPLTSCALLLPIFHTRPISHHAWSPSQHMIQPTMQGNSQRPLSPHIPEELSVSSLWPSKDGHYLRALLTWLKRAQMPSHPSTGSWAGFPALPDLQGATIRKLDTG